MGKLGKKRLGMLNEFLKESSHAELKRKAENMEEQRIWKLYKNLPNGRTLTTKVRAICRYFQGFTTFSGCPFASSLPYQLQFSYVVLIFIIWRHGRTYSCGGVTGFIFSGYGPALLCSTNTINVGQYAWTVR